ncbi:uncharacterized protein LOC110250642 [Exaiptasia diaphana]|uniref:Uncharacterized protein n=1 Tax=Exaiptasia diaphana TaxID=2652724 RepID=A0A913Y0Y0_EXADI|nr:uncharacterized protein LOC110250642 [Exaiptasia diaphana]
MCSFSIFLSFKILLIFFLFTAFYPSSFNQSGNVQECPKSSIAQKRLQSWKSYDNTNGKSTNVKKHGIPSGHHLENGDENRTKREIDREWRAKPQSEYEVRSRNVNERLDRQNYPSVELLMSPVLSHSNRLTRMKRTVSLESSKLLCKKEMSCGRRCGSNSNTVIYNEELSCYCDVNCVFFNDCCSDFEHICQGSQQPKDTSQRLGPPDLKPEVNKNRSHNEEWRCIDSDVSIPIRMKVTPPDGASQREKLEFVFTYCTGISWKPRNGDPRRYCLRIKSECDKSTSDRLHRECNETIVGLVNDNECIYKNIKCAKCNNKMMPNITCGPNGTAMEKKKKCPGTSLGPPISLPKPLSVLFDFNSPESTRVETKCNSAKVFDHHLGTCRKTLTLPKNSEVDGYKIILWAKLIDKRQNKELNPHPVHVILTKSNMSVPSEDLATVLHVNPRNIRNLRIALDSSIFEFEFDLIETLLKNNDSGAFDKILKFTKPFQITIVNFTFVVFKAISLNLSCPNFQVYWGNEYTPAVNQSTVYIKETGEVLHRQDYYLTGNGSRDILVCRRRTNCSEKWVLMEKEEFTVLRNRSVFINASKIMYAITEQFWQNRSLFVCENFSNRHSMIEKDERVSSILTLACMLMSIIGLLFVLVTYTLFAELRTTPGMNLINLSVAILLAQVLWIVGTWQTDKPMVCTAIAVLLHYFFLASFMWTSIIAFDTWRAFQSTNARCGLASSKRSKRLQLLRYMAVGWVFVMVFVGACVILDTTEVVKAGYTSAASRGCFIAKLGIVYFFIIPIALILLFNIVLYTLTMKAIHATTAQARVAVAHRNSRQSFWIYVRISSVMGFTWIFGFIAPFGAKFLWYPFIVLNSFQGVYIALAFGLNQRARNLYKNRFPSLALLWNKSANTEKNGSPINSEKTQEDFDNTKL